MENKLYDYIIIGGGIGGLNVAYQILKHLPSANLLILEKEKTLGGRVYTFKNKYMSVEAGAARFNITHVHFLSLLEELGLDHLKEPLVSSSVYIKSDGSGQIYNSVLDADKLVSEYNKKPDTNSGMYKLFQSMMNIGIDITMGKDTLPIVGLLMRVISAGMIESKEYLIKMTLLDYAKTILSSSEIKFLKDAFGYYSEIVVMNAYDSIRLMQGLNPNNRFYTLKGGLSKVISALEKKIASFKGATILKEKKVLKIAYKKNVFEIYGESFMFTGVKTICALPKQTLEKWTIFKPIRSSLSKIKCAPLCRIYSRFSVSPKVWFKGLPKFSTNNNLRMVIPISEKTGIIMISYTDNIFADFWHELNKESGVSGVNAELARLMKLSTGIDIPEPLETHVFYWKCGTGYWGVNADSDLLTQQFIQPYSDKNLFICGEHYSNIGQQWMEGAIETGNRVIQKMNLF